MGLFTINFELGERTLETLSEIAGTTVIRFELGPRDAGHDRAEAEEHRSEVAEEVENELADAHREAEEARQDAEELVADASDKLAEAARLSDEAARAARATAEEAQRQAQELTSQADRQTNEADEKVKTTEELRDQLVSTAKETARALNRDTTNGLSSYSKAELVDLAAGFRIRGRSSMTKDELVAALTTASRER
jgi:hypothetical protein